MDRLKTILIPLKSLRLEESGGDYDTWIEYEVAGEARSLMEHKVTLMEISDHICDNFLWLTPGSCVLTHDWGTAGGHSLESSSDEDDNEYTRYCWMEVKHASGKSKCFNLYALNPEEAKAGLHELVQLVSISDICEVVLAMEEDQCDFVPLPLDPSYLALLLQNQNLLAAEFRKASISEELAQAVAAVTSPMQVSVLDGCELLDNGWTLIAKALAENEGPSKLVLKEFYVESGALEGLFESLTTNTRLEVLKLCEIDGLGCTDFETLARSLSQNQGLVEMELTGEEFSDEIVTSLLHSLGHHPCLKTLRLSLDRNTRTPEEQVQLGRNVLQVLETNKVLQELDVASNAFDSDIWSQIQAELGSRRQASKRSKTEHDYMAFSSLRSITRNMYTNNI